MQPNKLGWVTGMSINSPAYDLVSADITIVASDPGALMKTFNEWLRGGINMPTFQSEFACLYCGSPNNIEKTHCRNVAHPARL